MHALVGLLVSPKKKTKKASEGLGTTLRDACRGRFLILMRFIDPRIFDSNDIHRPHPGPQENMQIGGVRCVSQIWSKFREMLGENPNL